MLFASAVLMDVVARPCLPIFMGGTSSLKIQTSLSDNIAVVNAASRG